MRKLNVLAIVFILHCLTKLDAQTINVPIISSQNGQTFCATYDFNSERPHICLMTEMPIPQLENSKVSYTWISRHAKGTFTWNTRSSERLIPIPWEGKYDIKLIIKYFRDDRQRPYAAILSNTYSIQGVACKTDQNPPQEINHGAITNHQ